MNMPSSSAYDNRNDKVFWYFSIGSMMNQISLKNRNINPIQSVPGELMDYEIKFSGDMGFAEAKHCPGSSFHGVMHLVDSETMESLDKIEISYRRVEGKARMYDGTICDVTVYTMCSEFSQEQIDNPPFQRYLDIMIEGALHFKIDLRYVEFLRSVQCRPRPLPDEFKAFDSPSLDAPLLSYEKDVIPYNGENAPILRLAVNGKILEVNIDEVPSTNILFLNSLNIYKTFGQRLEFVVSKVMYDPMYGCPDRIEDFTREHAEYVEHSTCLIAASTKTRDLWKTVGKIVQSYKD